MKTCVPNLKDPVVVAADLGFAKKGRNYAADLDTPIAFIEKRRAANDAKAEALTLIGNVEDRDVIIVDDEVDTGGSTAQAVHLVRDKGARDIYLAFIHGVLVAQRGATFGCIAHETHHYHRHCSYPAGEAGVSGRQDHHPFGMRSCWEKSSAARMRGAVWVRCSMNKRYSSSIQKTCGGGQPMKGNQKILETLNELLADELTAINQYMVQSEMCADWGYEKLHEAIEKRAIEEMKHAEKLIGRILFLEGIPIVSNLKKINIGATVDAQHKNDHEAEEMAIKAYNDGIKLAVEVGDNGTRDMLEEILEDEEEHIDWIESQLDQIEQMGLQVYLGEQLEE